MFLIHNAGRSNPLYTMLLTKGDQGELYRARWQLSSEERALLILPGSVSSKLWRGGESSWQSHVSGNPHNSGVMRGGGHEAGN